jgi:hypothetical protein
MGIISACLPVLRQPLAHLFPRIFGTIKITTTGNTNAGGGGKYLRTVGSNPGPASGGSRVRQLHPASADNNNHHNNGTEDGHRRASDERCIVGSSDAGSSCAEDIELGDRSRGVGGDEKLKERGGIPNPV